LSEIISTKFRQMLVTCDLKMRVLTKFHLMKF